MFKAAKLFLAIAIVVAGYSLGIHPGFGAAPGWSGIGPSDDIGASVIDPGNESIILASGTTGLWKTTNGGATWSTISQAKVSALAVDPKNSSVIYGTGDETAPGGVGIYKSMDGGKNWSVVRTGDRPSKIVIDPASPRTVYAGAMINNNYEVLKSTDEGASWNKMMRPTGSQSPGMGYVTALGLAPSNPNTIYAGIGLYHGGDLRRSDDGGVTWRSIVAKGGSTSLAAPSAIAVGPQNPNLVYAAWTVWNSKTLFKTLDGGVTWQELTASLPKRGGSIAQLVIAPGPDGAVFASIPGNEGQTQSGPAGGIFASYDGGASWSELGTAGADKGLLVLAPKSQLLYCGSSDGLLSYALSVGSGGPDARFGDYYVAHDGVRVLGSPLSQLLTVQNWPSQYFEKGRLEDHSREVSDPNWRFMFGLLTDELQNAKAVLPVGGEVSTLNYANLNQLASQGNRLAPPAGFTGGVFSYPDGSVFIPYEASLAREAGHKVPGVFWQYISRDDLFPGGWLHDVGLPMTEPVQATVDKGDLKGRVITVQLFQRTVLTYDSQNPKDWQVERANVGTDYLKVLGQ